eukprot:49378_1
MYHQIRANNNGQNRANHPQNRANNNRQIRANHPQNRDVNGPMCYQIRANNNRQNCANNNRQIPAVLAATQPNNAAQILSKRPLQKSISRLAKRIAHDMYATCVYSIGKWGEAIQSMGAIRDAVKQIGVNGVRGEKVDAKQTSNLCKCYGFG